MKGSFDTIFRERPAFRGDFGNQKGIFIRRFFDSSDTRYGTGSIVFFFSGGVLGGSTTPDGRYTSKRHIRQDVQVDLTQADKQQRDLRLKWLDPSRG